jgi:nicotinamidase-related amidase
MPCKRGVPSISRRGLVGGLAAAAASAGLSHAMRACASEASDAGDSKGSDKAAPTLPVATGYSMPDGVTLCDDGTIGDVLVVVDMQNAYLEDQVWACVHTTDCAERIERLIASGAVDNVVFTQYLAPENPTGTWVTYDEVYADISSDEWLNEIIDQLEPYLDTYPLYAKSTFSSFGNPDFKALMAKARRIVISGVVSECCVIATTIDAIDTGAPVVYLTDACSGGSDENEGKISWLVGTLSPVHTAVMTTQQYIDARSKE